MSVWFGIKAIDRIISAKVQAKTGYKSEERNKEKKKLRKKRIIIKKARAEKFFNMPEADSSYSRFSNLS